MGESHREWKVGRDLGGSSLSHKEPGSQTGLRHAELFLQFILPGVQFRREDGRGHGWAAPTGDTAKSSAFGAQVGTQMSLTGFRKRCSDGEYRSCAGESHFQAVQVYGLSGALSWQFYSAV